MRPDEPDDAGLVRAIARGSQEALGQLYDRHAAAIHAVAARLASDRQVAEEVVQETFLTLWNRAELFDPAAGSLAAWLHTIARHRAIDRLRAAGRRPNLVALSAVGGRDEPEAAAFERLAHEGRIAAAGAVALDPEAAHEAAELQARLRDVLAGMPEVERTVVVLAYRDELTQAEIADRLGWPIGTVKTRTRRALRRMRDALTGTSSGESAVRARRPVPLHERGD